MSYIEQWSAISARIRALGEVGKLYATLHTGAGKDRYGGSKDLADNCNRVLGAINDFYERFEDILPRPVLNCISDFPAAEADQHTVPAKLVALLAFESEMAFLLSDKQEMLRVRSERAFSHLRRLLAVDLDFRTRWNAAFESGEVECEKLGGVHLLWHGIWAFKVNAAGARTDLVFEEPVEHTYQRGAEGLVLTEWKVGNAKNAAKRFKEARAQAELYKRGALAGIELSGYRYVVVVSKEALMEPDNLDVNGIIYRHINVPIEPASPSRIARKKEWKAG